MGHRTAQFHATAMLASSAVAGTTWTSMRLRALTTARLQLQLQYHLHLQPQTRRRRRRLASVGQLLE